MLELFRLALVMMSRRERRMWLALLGVVLGISAIIFVITLAEIVMPLTDENVRLVLFSIAMMTLLGSAVGISLAMHAAVIERTHELGIMKALGASSNQTSGLIVLESAVLGLLGGLAGIAAGGLALLLMNIVSLVNGTSIYPSLPVELALSALALGAGIGSASGWLSVKKVLGDVPARIIARP